MVLTGALLGNDEPCTGYETDGWTNQRFLTDGQTNRTEGQTNSLDR